MNYRWTLLPSPNQDSIISLVSAIGCSAITSQLLLQRGVTTYEEASVFTNPIKGKWHDPLLMKDLDKAILRILKAKEKEESVFVFGDYDVDGTTSVALMSDYLKKLGLSVYTYIPDRYKEGYGLSTAGIDEAAAKGCSLLIALDCGIKSVDKVEYGNSLGLDFIICDHHNPGEDLPPALAVLDPKRADCLYPYKELSGCGVGFKLIQGIQSHLGLPLSDLIAYTDLLAVSIGADIVPLTGENRILAAQGIEVLNTKPRHGLAALMEVSKKKGFFDIESVVFQIAPRINAAGRIDHGHIAVELLTTDNVLLAMELAEKVNQLNIDRRVYDENITSEALAELEGKENKSSTVVYNENWHKGVIGIAASRLIEHHYKPTIVLTKSGDVLAGSARSVHGFNLYDALEKCSGELIQFGGHAFAAGMTLLPEKLSDFSAAFEKVVKSSITEEQKTPRIDVDMPLQFSDISMSFYNTIQRFGPFGPQNMNPLFISFGLNDCGSKQVGAESKHLKLELVSQDGIVFSGIAFGKGHLLEKVQTGMIDILYNLSLNTFRDKSNLQLMIKDLRESQLN